MAKSTETIQDKIDRLDEIVESKRSIMDRLERLDATKTASYNTIAGQVIGLNIAINILRDKG